MMEVEEYIIYQFYVQKKTINKKKEGIQNILKTE